jgi:hypothetical protein
VETLGEEARNPRRSERRGGVEERGRGRGRFYFGIVEEKGLEAGGLVRILG